MKTVKKQLATLMTLVMLISLFPLTIFAFEIDGVYENGNGNESVTYEDQSYPVDNDILREEEFYDEDIIEYIEEIVILQEYMDIVPFGNIPSLYGIETWPQPPAITFPTLSPGQIWAGKTVEYNRNNNNELDGTVTLRIYVLGATYGEQGNMPLSDTNPYLTIMDYLGDFWLASAVDDPPNLVYELDNSGKNITWRIHQSLFVGTAEPFFVEYTLYLDPSLGPDPEPWRSNVWYSTEGGTTDIIFEPTETNPYYFTNEEHWIAAFEVVGSSWNNGRGMNNATFRDNILGMTFVFGSNNSTVANRTAADDYNIPARWANIVIGGRTYEWHLEWSDTERPAGSGLYPYVITIRYFQFPDNTIANLQFEMNLDGPGGSKALAGDRVIRSEEYFRRHFVENHPEIPFDWEQDLLTNEWILRQTLDVVGKILLSPPEVRVGTLRVGKMITGEFAEDWGYVSDENFNFTARVQATTTINGASEPSWAVFREVQGLTNVFDFIGFTQDDSIAQTYFTFSAAHPAEIRGLPAQESFAEMPFLGEHWQYFVNEIFGFEDHGLVTDTKRPGLVSHDLDPEGVVLEPYQFFCEVDGHDDEIRITIENYFPHGRGNVEVFKMFSGFPDDWGIDDDSTFYVRIWDVQAENYLLFDSEMRLDDDVLSGFDEHYWGIGNHAVGLSEAHPGGVIMELPIRVSEPIRLANLWTWGAYEVREVRRTGDEAAMNAAWDDFWSDVVRIPYYERERYHPLLDAEWISLQRVWLADWVATGWEPIEEITSDAEWHARPVDEWYWGVVYSDNNPTYDLEVGQTIRIAVTNRYKFKCGTLIFEKELCENAAAWGQQPDTMFHAQVLTDETIQRALVFVPSPAGQTEYFRVVGFMGINPQTGLADEAYGYEVLCPVGSPLPPANAETIISFSVNTPATLIEVPRSPYGDVIVYTVQEVFIGGEPPGFDFSEPEITGDMDFVTTDDGTVYFDHLSSRTATIRNSFYLPTGNLIISKELTGDFDGWDVNDETPFFAGVYRDDERIRLYRPEAGVYVYVDYTNRLDYIGDAPGAAVDVISFNAGQPTVLIGLTTYRFTPPYAQHNYSVVELFNAAGDPLPNRNEARFSAEVGTIYREGDNLFVTITNDFIPRPERRNGGGPRTPPDADEPGEQRTVRDFFVEEHIWYIRGYEDTTIRPDNTITRAEVSMAFYRLLRPEMKNITQRSPFNDVRDDAWYGKGVAILAYHEILTGYEDGTFRPNAYITRRELAAIVSRFDQLIDTDVNPYRDVYQNDWAFRYILSATEKGWFIGYGGLFRPGAGLTRAEFVTAVNRVLVRHILLEDVPDDVFNFPDLDSSHWAYTAFMEATHTHEYVRREDGINEIWIEILSTGLDAAYNE